MVTSIKLVEGDTLIVQEDYRSVYEKLFAVGWREPCEFITHDEDGAHPVTVNPSYIVNIRAH